jgi:hypothetical protein
MRHLAHATGDDGARAVKVSPRSPFTDPEAPTLISTEDLVGA